MKNLSLLIPQIFIFLTSEKQKNHSRHVAIKIISVPKQGSTKHVNVMAQAGPLCWVCWPSHPTGLAKVAYPG
jgi:hypothetical protein